jgi:hypothetical protein
VKSALFLYQLVKPSEQIGVRGGGVRARTKATSVIEVHEVEWNAYAFVNSHGLISIAPA